ncbi:hypothetical protein E9531_10510 [Lampropedia puyangensis]|uniref:Uncharacterized protein n=1 Tax=Lampropedia puyangensis TaxID=1330072 RepID=A0A4S8F0C6_9BURK|nr:hypothetical protein [Lampropedia puyangensis]THU00690.1 hypothetical protein E9531_10510 [Lampropedia puyangensis]
MPVIHDKKQQVQKQQGKALEQPRDSSLYLAVSHAAEVRDPVVRAASVWGRIVETTALHWGMAAVSTGVHQPLRQGGLSSPALRTPVWFAY